MSDKNSPIEVDTGPLPKISSLASNHLLKYDDCDGYLTSNDDGDDDDDGHTAYHNPERNLEIAIYLDDVAEFITQMELLFGSDDSNDSLEPGETVKPNTREPMLCPSRILSRICARGALACVTALLQGETCVYVDLNVPFDEGDFPLHLVASRQNYDLVKLFLYYGARTDLLDYFVSERVSLPLNAALEQLNKHPYFDYWSPVESMCRLLIILCLPQMKVALDTNRLLALHTEDVNEIFIDYAKEGKLIEMAVLLMVGNVRIIAPRTFQTKDGGIVEGGMTIRNTINDKSKVREYHGVYMGTLVPMCNGESASFTLTLLKLFVAAGDAIRSYIQSQTIHVPKEKVVNGVACILKESGFVLKETDIDLSNIDCESDHIKEVTGTSENNAAYESWKYGLMVLNVRITSFDEEDEEADLMSKDKDSGLSNIDCESNEIKEATDSSGNIIAYEPKMRPSMFPDRYRHFKVLKEASDFQCSVGETNNMDVHHVLELRSPIIVKVLKGMCFINNQIFRKHLRDFYPLITKLVCCDQLEILLLQRDTYMNYSRPVSTVSVGWSQNLSTFRPKNVVRMVGCTLKCLILENWQRGWILLLWFIVMAALFTWKFNQYREKTVFQIMGYCLTTTKGAAETLKVNMALILLPVCRNMLTWLWSTPAKLFIPFDDNINFHKIIAYAIAIGIVVHAGNHMICDPVSLCSRAEFKNMSVRTIFHQSLEGQS